jgi:RNA polymerase sigma-70 factor (ECF subfamily)
MQQPIQALEQSTALYQHYAPTVFAYLLRRLGSREDAEDVLLEVFLVVLEKGPALEQDEQRMRSWIWTIVRNKVVDHYRRFTRRPSVPLADVEEMIYESDEREPEQVALRREEYAQLRNSMKELPELQREVLQLRFGHGLSCAEIAQVVSKSESAVRMLLHRSLKLLRGLYTRGEQEGVCDE